MDRKKILIAEDERKIAQVLYDYLIQAGFSAHVLDRGDNVVPYVRNMIPDLILLDLMLPGMDGIEICKELRKFTNVPIIMVTAKVEEIDRLLGLEIGADDYICKPFSPREVVARVKAIMRRVTPHREVTEIEVGPLMLNVTTHQASVNKKQLTLTPSEFELLKVLMSHPGRVFNRSELLYQAQGTTFEAYERTIDSHIKNLRKKIAQKYEEEEIIVSIYGVGYKLLEC